MIQHGTPHSDQSLTIIILNLSGSSVGSFLYSAKCMDIMMNYCDDMSYTHTVFPNILGHRTREEAELGPEYLLLSVVHNLLNGECTPDIRMLGCSVLVPRCEKEKV
jgi:carboxypeptidase Z